MLITNFSAGELSSTLFGRTDIPQYYSGAARMENFDVIPTGGIKRRGGMERLASLAGEGRLIPFIVNRALNFLLFLSPGKITAYRVEDGNIAGTPEVFASNGDRRVYENMGHIRNVQCAQNYNTMILCHEDYPPLEVNLETGSLRIGRLELSFQKTVVKGQNISEDDVFPYKNDDETYVDGWLTREGHYPAAVSFYNGRLVFACTESNRQQVFFSAIKERGKPYNFATTKVVLEEDMKYIVIQGSVQAEAKNTILIEGGEGLKFTSALENYYIDSPFYDPGTKIVSLQASILRLSNEANIEEITQEQKNEITNMITRAEIADTFPIGNKKLIASYPIVITDYQDVNHLETQTLHLIPGATKIKIEKRTTNISNSFFYMGDYEYRLDEKAVLLYENDNSYYEIFVRNSIKGISSQVVDANNNYTSYANIGNIDAAVQTLRDNSLATMKYQLVLGDNSYTYYNLPFQIQNIVTRRFENNNNIFIPFYTREIIAREYPTPDCGFTLEPASAANDAIRWLAVNKGLVIGTEMGEYVVPPDVHATNVRAERNGGYGSDGIQGTAVGDATIFFQSGKKSLVEYYIPQADNHFRANNMAMLCPEMLSESPARELDFMTSPHTRLLVTREDGAMATLLYERSTGTFAWARITTGPEDLKIEDDRWPWRREKLASRGRVLSAAVLPGGDGNDDAWLAVVRDGAHHLERLRENCRVYLDSWQPVDKGNWAGIRRQYGAKGVMACRTHTDADGRELHETLGADAEPDWAKGGQHYIGYTYTSIVRTMPVVVGKEIMRKNNIVDLTFRFLDSYMPNMTGYYNGKRGGTDRARLAYREPPYSGVHKQNFPSDWAEDAQAEVSKDEPEPLCILALDTVMDKAQ
jgi:hypothetical protein